MRVRGDLIVQDKADAPLGEAALAEHFAGLSAGEEFFTHGRKGLDAGLAGFVFGASQSIAIPYFHCLHAIKLRQLKQPKNLLLHL